MVDEPGTKIQSLQDANPTNTPNGADTSQTPPIQASAVKPSPTDGMLKFPDDASRRRLGDYEYYMRLFMGEHFEAFNIRINDEKYTREYSKLRYIMVNFAGLISKVVADMLFSEPPTFYTLDETQDTSEEDTPTAPLDPMKPPAPKKKTKENPVNDWIEAFIEENDLHTQNYESALDNSAMGDTIYKLRIGERFKGDGEPTVIAESCTPKIYFPQVNGFNVRDNPEAEELCWTFYIGKDKFLRKEIHTIGMIENQVWSMQGEYIKTKQPLSILDPDMQEFEETKIKRSLIVHIPNWKTGSRYFGISDYYDLDKLFYAINNRFTKVDNILDKHGDPILAVPDGVLDEKGNVKKGSLGVIEMGADGEGKPEYIVWDAKLESAFSEIDRLVDAMLMVAEISHDVVGANKDGTTADSGKALKFKMLRTLAKVARKKLYYDRGLKELIYTAQLLAKAHNVKVGGLDAPAEAVRPEIEWQDGLPSDMGEQVDIEAKRLDSGTTTVTDSIMRLDGVDQDTAEKKAEDIKQETAIAMPVSNLSAPFPPSKGDTSSGGKPVSTSVAQSGMMKNQPPSMKKMPAVK